MAMGGKRYKRYRAASLYDILNIIILLLFFYVSRSRVSIVPHPVSSMLHHSFLVYQTNAVTAVFFSEKLYSRANCPSRTDLRRFVAIRVVRFAWLNRRTLSLKASSSSSSSSRYPFGRIVVAPLHRQTAHRCERVTVPVHSQKPSRSASSHVLHSGCRDASR